MILFKPEHVPLILAGTKTQTRRLVNQKRPTPRWKVGAAHKCYTKPPFAQGGSTPFATVTIKAVRQELLALIPADDVRTEGYSSRREYLDAFHRINARAPGYIQSQVRVWVIVFALVDSHEGARQ